MVMRMRVTQLAMVAIMRTRLTISGYVSCLVTKFGCQILGIILFELCYWWGFVRSRRLRRYKLSKASNPSAGFSAEEFSVQSLRFKSFGVRVWRRVQNCLTLNDQAADGPKDAPLA